MGEEVIYISFGLQNPWSKRKFGIIKIKHFILANHKNIEIGLYKSSNIIGTTISFHPRRDHGGFSFDIALLGFMFEIEFYDSRHWNDEAGTYNENY